MKETRPKTESSRSVELQLYLCPIGDATVVRLTWSGWHARELYDGIARLQSRRAFAAIIYLESRETPPSRNRSTSPARRGDDEGHGNSEQEAVARQFRLERWEGWVTAMSCQEVRFCLPKLDIFCIDSTSIHKDEHHPIHKQK